MYAEKGKGIRIELDEDMFYEYKAEDTQYVKVVKQMENPLMPLSEIIRDDYIFFTPLKSSYNLATFKYNIFCDLIINTIN